MFLPRVVSRLNLLSKVSGSLQNQSQALCSVVQHCHSTHFRALKYSKRCFTSAADNKLPPKLWTPLEPELEEVLVPRKLSVSPLESWLSLRYSLPPLLEASPPLDEDPTKEDEQAQIQEAAKTDQVPEEEGERCQEEEKTG
ncbi:aurora kinase A-interacting protein isoform X2 [Carassius gibelio]|uniref:aurora kinase A-interacting protein isoform X2 n=1 Tax=Carassius gibelio TaxID=101364 RepID=UPI00227751E2|nr:aurora kinase A-interacting protein isoform X2 [Carassius gibelio]